MDADEISRKVLAHLDSKTPKSARFKDMCADLEIGAQALSKNLFYLEDNRLVTLATSVGVDSTFPTIHVVKLTEDGGMLAVDNNKLKERFPGRGHYHDQEPHEATYESVFKLFEKIINSDGSIGDEKKKTIIDSLEELSKLKAAGRKVFP